MSVASLVPPVLVEVDRGGLVESRHRGSVVALDAGGETVLALGDVTATMLPRSALKPLQATAMVRAGLVLSDAQLALACASHVGEPAHRELVAELLAAHGLDAGALQNPPAAASGDRLGAECSGKHAAMLATCIVNGWPLDAYRDPGHPLQRLIRATIEQLAGEAVRAVQVDGCGAPLFGLSLVGLARAFGALAAGDPGSAERRVADAMRAHPWAVAGAGDVVTRLLAGVPQLVCKSGVEGVFAAALPGRGAVAVKVEDGDGARRAATPVLVTGLQRLGIEADVLDELASSPVTGGDAVVGAVRATLAHQRPRVERDLLGERSVPGDVYYGIHTLRAVENFPISRTPISSHRDLVVALACVKQAAALANCDLGLIDAATADAIVAACEEIRAGALHDQFVVDVIQGGAGTSTNMNANEVIANRALELLGHARGDYARLDPLDHVNCSQSTNDVYPTAVNVALHRATERLLDAMRGLREALEERARTFAGDRKLGRTQLQDAVPMTLGQEFHAFAVMLGEDELRLAEAAQLTREVNLGGTAIGTGLNAPDGYAAIACAHLARIAAIPLAPSADLIEASQDVGHLVQLSGVLKRVAVKLSKMCSDLRLLSSGPFAGLGEINLPAVQAGSSIMPGKVNPVIPEVVNQIAYEVIGHDVTISCAAESGQLQLNAFGPIIAHSLLESLEHLRAGCATLAERCIGGITANRERLRALVERSVGLVTALGPYLGHARCDELAREAIATGRSIPELVLARELLDPQTLAGLLDAAQLACTPAQRP